MTRRGWAIFATVLTVVAWLVLPDPLFLIAAVLVAIASALACAGYWYEEAIRSEADRIHAVFEAAGYRLDLVAMTEDYESTLTRLSEVLDEHSLCPAPVEIIDPPAIIRGPLKVVTDGPVPPQRISIEIKPVDAETIERMLIRLRRSRGQGPVA